jgi:hypothetical protein
MQGGFSPGRSSYLTVLGLTTSTPSRATAGDVPMSAIFSFAEKSKKPPVMISAMLYDIWFLIRSA